METRQERRQHEIDLARRMQDGEAGLFDEFARSVGARLLGYSQLVCGSREDAEDVVQETLLQAYRKLPELRDFRHVHAWFFRIARNACLMKRRQEQEPAANCAADGLESPETAASPMTDPEIALLNAELSESIESAIGLLPENYRMVVLLRCVEELSTGETAEALGVSEDVVRAWLHRARQALSKSIGRTS